MLLRNALIIGVILRVGLLIYSDWHDRHLEVPFTDVDYQVFTDAARFVDGGESPYTRATYRYTPLLAYLLLGNIWWHPAWGKVVFSAADLMVAWTMHNLATLSGCDPNHAVNAALAWLLNPFAFTISTRGSSDALVAFVLLATLMALRCRQTGLAGVLWGFAVHWRMFPIIYAPSIMCFLALKNATIKQGSKPNKISLSHQILQNAFCMDCIKFGITAGTTLFGSCLMFYKAYGHQFLNEAYFHHLWRRDPRHNFSVYFYPVYLHDHQPHDPSLPTELLFDVSKWALIPPALLILMASWRLADHLPFCWLVVTMVFVSFNKVCTAQYFVWYFCLFPLVALQMSWPPRRSLPLAFLFWIASQLNWLGWAYMLEFQGASVFSFVWASSCVFMIANSALIFAIAQGFCPRASFLQATVSEASKNLSHPFSSGQ